MCGFSRRVLHPTSARQRNACAAESRGADLSDDLAGELDRPVADEEPERKAQRAGVGFGR
jgi:hypothetical protein